MTSYCYKDKNGRISKPQHLPNIWGNVVNFDSQAESKLNAHGWYRYVKPTYDHYTQELGNLFLDKSKNIITNKVLDKSLSLNDEIDKKIDQLQDYISNLLSKTDKYFIRKLERNIEPPQEIIDERKYIHNKCDSMKEEIQTLTSTQNVINYNYNINSKLNYH